MKNIKESVREILSFIQRYVFSYAMYENVKQCWCCIRTFWLLSLFRKCPSSVRFGEIGLLKGAEYISIGENCTFGDGLHLTAWYNRLYEGSVPQLTIEDNCCFGLGNHITCANEIIIGEGCLTGKWVTISDNNHGNTDINNLQKLPLHRDVISKGIVKIGKNVWIGEKSTILSGVVIGDGVVVAANSVVCHDVPSFCVVAGSPAKIIKQVKQN